MDYLRKVLAEQTDFNAKGTEYVPVDKLPPDHRYFEHQEKVNGAWVPSQEVLRQ